jgi:hypothetical protein
MNWGWVSCKKCCWYSHFEFPHRFILFDPYASGCVGLIHCDAMLEFFFIILDLQATTAIIIGFWGTLSFLWILLGQHFYTCHLSVGGPFGMVFEHVRDLFDLEDSMNVFIQLHQLCSHVVVGCNLGCVVWILGACWLLALAKLSSGIHLIAVGKTFYQLMDMTLCL